MSFEDAILPDLLVCCCDAPDAAQRSAAHRLLAAELAAKLRNSAIDSEHHAIPHPVFADLALGTHAPGGVRAATFYALCRKDPYGGVPRQPASDYGSISAAVIAEATPLIAAVRAAMGDAFDAERFGFNDSVLPGDAFKHHAVLHFLEGPDIVLDAAGVWRVQVRAKILAHSPTPGVAVGFSLVVSGTGTVATYSQSRADVDDDVDELVAFDTSADITVAGARTLTVVNSSANDELIVAGGQIRFWEV